MKVAFERVKIEYISRVRLLILFKMIWHLWVSSAVKLCTFDIGKSPVKFVL